jgi:AraC-like DNA-binding protein
MTLPLSQLIKEILFYLLLHPKTSNSKSLVSVLIETLSEGLEAQGVQSISGTDHLIGKIDDERIRKVVSYIADNLSERISTNDLVSRSGMSSRNLNRLMLKEVGLTPRQFLIFARIEKAQELLQKPGSSVTEVAFEVGYGSLSQFIAAFRSQTGQLPSEVARFGRKPKI